MKFCTTCGIESLETKTQCSYCAERNRQILAHKRSADRKKVLQHYSHTNPPSCACCGEINELFLTVDHIIPIPQKEKVKNKTAHYSYIVKAKFPAGLRILCMNCNHGRMRNGGICPHKSIKVLPDILPKKRIKSHYPKKKLFWIMKNRDKFALQINDDKGFGRIYAGTYKTKKEALLSAKNNWGLDITASLGSDK